MLRTVACLLITCWLSAAAQPDACPITTQDLQKVADDHLRQGRFAQGERMIRACIRDWEKLLPPAHPGRLAAASYLGLIVLLSGRVDEAETLLQDAYTTARAGNDPIAIATAASYLGSFYRYRRDTARALPLLRLAHQQIVEMQGPEAGPVGSALMEIGAVQAGDGKFALAEENFLAAMAILQKNHMLTEIRINEIYIAAVQVEQGRTAEAEARLLRAIQDNRDTSTLASSTRAMALYHLARLYRLANRPNDAHTYYRAAIAAYDEAVVQPFPQMSEVLTEYAQFLKRRHHPEAKVWAARAKQFQPK